MLGKIVTKIVDFLSSFGLAAVLLLLLLLLTVLGTVDQVDQGLYAAQQKYFSSLFLVLWIGPLPILLPGVYLLLLLLFVNLILGGILRARLAWSRLGLFIAHAGIALLLVAGFVTRHMAEEGHVTLYERESSDEFVSYHEWEIGAYRPAESGEVTEWAIPGEDFMDLGPGESRRFVSDALPFAVEVSDFLRNSMPRPARESGPGVVDGFRLEEQPWAKEAERNTAGLLLTVREPDGGERRALLWGAQRRPWIVTIGGEAWAFDLRKRRRKMPFTIRLDDFIRDLHPGTGMARAFKSEVTKIEGDRTREALIQMNEPLRDRGYTLFQASWGPADAGPNDRLFSTFAVVRNPADQWPLYSCIVITLGLLLHFGRKLLLHLIAEARRDAAAPWLFLVPGGRLVRAILAVARRRA